MSVRCAIGLHEWESTEVGTIPPSETPAGNGLVLIFKGRTFWDNTCRRCGKVVGPTYPYDPQKRRI